MINTSTLALRVLDAIETRDAIKLARLSDLERFWFQKHVNEILQERLIAMEEARDNEARNDNNGR